MKTSKVIRLERRMRREKMPVSSIYTMPSHVSSANRHLARRCGIAVLIVIAFLVVLSSAAFGANPAEEMAKAAAGGGIDPKGNSWLSIEKSVEQFAHPSFILRLFLSLTSGGRLRVCYRMASASRVTAGSTEGFRGTQGTHTPWRGRGRRCRTKWNQPNARRLSSSA